MRLRLFSSVLVALLLCGASAHATDVRPVRLIADPQARCIEQPISLAFAIAEHEASRWLSADSLESDATPVLATPAASTSGERIAGRDVAPRPFSPSPRACTSPNDPACHVTAPPAPHESAPFHMFHAGIAGTVPDPAVPPAYSTGVVTFVPARADEPSDGFSEPVWRPPAC